MKKSTKVLGKGLNALIRDTDAEMGPNRLAEVNINDVVPNNNQPRKEIEGIKELADSIKEYGVIQPILVMDIGGTYQIIAGERRWRAAKLAGLAKINVIIKKSVSAKDKLEIALIENLQRRDLNPIEEGESYKKLIDEFELSVEYLSKVFGKDRTTITNTIRLLNLPPFIKDDLKHGLLQAGHARPLINIKDEKLMREIRDKIVNNKISVREVERMINKDKIKRSSKTASKKNSSHISDIEEKFREKFSTKVKISGNESKGRVIIEYYSSDDLERIMDVLNLN
ncbi:MAG: ParB/RepB/Spo0J family partition protein [Spirochaetes bacterium]|nr:ParB/RepB/Spo0J family partition protein [Spirochaetota bacterium]